MKLKYHFETVTIGDKLEMVPVGSTAFNGVLTVNETMKDLMDLLAEERTEEEVISAMLEQYEGVSREEMTATVWEICDGLRKEGLLEG